MAYIQNNATQPSLALGSAELGNYVDELDQIQNLLSGIIFS